MKRRGDMMSIKRYKQKLVLILISLGVFGCNPYSYVRTAPPTPMFEKEKEVQVNLFSSYNHVEAQASYAVTDHLGMSLVAFAGYQGAAAIDVSVFGYRSILNKSGGANRYFISYGVGFATGYANNTTLGDFDFILNNRQSVKATYISPSLNFSAYRIVTKDIYKKTKLGLGLKTNYLYYSTISYYIDQFSGSGFSRESYSASYSGRNKSAMVTDLYFLSSFPLGKRFVFLIQAGYSIPISFDLGKSYDTVSENYSREPVKPPQPLIFQQIILNFGLQFHLNVKNRKKDEI